MIDGMDMRDFLLGDAEESGRDIVLYLQGNRLQAAKWHQWKVHLFKQDDFYSTWSPLNMPLLYNLEWDPREEHQVDFPHGWVVHPIAAAAGAFLKSLVVEPPIKPGTPDPYAPPKPGELLPQTHLQIGPIIQYVTTLVRTHDEPPGPQPRDRAPDRMSGGPADALPARAPQDGARAPSCACCWPALPGRSGPRRSAGSWTSGSRRAATRSWTRWSSRSTPSTRRRSMTRGGPWRAP